MTASRVVVSAVIAAGILWLAWSRLPIGWAVLVTILLAFEGWTFINGTPRDTLSESTRFLARRQLLVPWLFGAATGIAIASTYLSDPYVISALLMLQGHLFFTLDEHREP